MSIDPRRSGVTLWALWVASSALGQGLATLLAFSWLGAMVNGSDNPAALPYDLRLRAYFGTVTAIAALFQALLLTLVAPAKRTALLWLLASAIGAGLFFLLLQDGVENFSLSSTFTSLPRDTASAILDESIVVTYALGLGLAQGAALALITARKMAPAVWIAASLVALPLSMYVAGIAIEPQGTATSFVASNALSHGAGAAVTGLALVLIFRLGRRDRIRAPGLAARSPLAPTP